MIHIKFYFDQLQFYILDSTIIFFDSTKRNYNVHMVKYNILLMIFYSNYISGGENYQLLFIFNKVKLKVKNKNKKIEKKI